MQGTPDKALASWLREPGSLTARCQRNCGQFRIRLLRAGWIKPMADEPASRGLIRGREVVLECDGQPVIFAHSVLLTASKGRLPRWLAGLASRSLGSLLFTHPGFKREALAFRQLDARHPLFLRAAAWAPGAAELWARRSVHHLGTQSLCVTEVFLPAILRVTRQKLVNFLARDVL